MRRLTKEELVKKVESEWNKVKERGRNGGAAKRKSKGGPMTVCKRVREEKIKRKSGECMVNEEEGA